VHLCVLTQVVFDFLFNLPNDCFYSGLHVQHSIDLLLFLLVVAVDWIGIVLLSLRRRILEARREWKSVSIYLA
jgi:hypothetical protein